MTNINVVALREGTILREGAGVKLRRYIGADRNNALEPFLLLDFFDSNDPMDFQAGFPPHPHRGFETITYLLKGQIRHQDNQGHEGLIAAGDVQWMTAGRGLIHSEMPMSEEGSLKGLQVWLNLPAADKYCAPNYQEFKSEELPLEQLENGGVIKVIAGKTPHGTLSPITGIATDPIFFDVQLSTSQVWQQDIPSSHQSLVLVIDGEITIQQQIVSAGQLAVLSAGDTLTLETSHSHFLFMAAKKLHEPIERLGPFVMNTPEEIAQAVDDLRNNRF
jgi:redox-sensitive bicupin YhaK (pirin superfamily)